MAMITWSRMNRLRKPLVERNYRIMRSTYLEIGRDFVNRVRRFGIQVVTDGDVKTADATPLTEAYKRIFTDTAMYFARIGRDSFPKTRKFDEEEFLNSRWVNGIQQNIDKLILQANFSERLYGTAIEEITRIARIYIDQGISTGMSIESIADMIVKDYLDLYGESAKWMARRVAQTETIRASNFGTKEGVNGLGIDYVQSWLSTHDGRERPSHDQAAIDNNRIPSDQLFRVGGYDCEYPGDPALPPEESINCRCAWTAEPID